MIAKCLLCFVHLQMQNMLTKIAKLSFWTNWFKKSKIMTANTLASIKSY